MVSKLQAGTLFADLTNGKRISVPKRNGLAALIMRAGALGGGASIVRVNIGENTAMWFDDGEPCPEWSDTGLWVRPKAAPDFPLRHFKNSDDAREWFIQMVSTCDGGACEHLIAYWDV